MDDAAVDAVRFWSMQTGMYRTDAGGRCVWVNSKLCELFELERDEILELGWTRRIHPSDAARVEQLRSHAIGPLSTFEIEYRIEVPVAGTRRVSAFSTALVTGGEFAGRIGIVRDVTDRPSRPL
jgi:PAS domain S-box-containing protein